MVNGEDEMTPYRKTMSFNRKILGIKPRTLGMMSEKDFKFALVSLREEVDEMEEAYNSGDFTKFIDALVDIQYYHHGILYKNGIPSELYNLFFDAVHQANMNKEPGVNKGRGDLGVVDAIKPPNWCGPESDIEGLIKQWMKNNDN